MHTPLTIAKPCHQNWSKMSNTGEGKFCDSCQKTVHDLTQLSNDKLILFLKEKGSHVCGRFRTEQLDKVPKKQHSLFSSFSLKAASVAALLVTRLFSPLSVKAQDMKYTYPICPKTDDVNAINVVNTTPTLITGIVVDHKSGEPLEGARVYIIVDGKTISAYSDSLGNFTLKAEGNTASSKIDVVVKMAGYKSSTFNNYTPTSEPMKARLTYDKNYRYYSMGCPSF